MWATHGQGGKKREEGTILLIVYVDDIILTGDDRESIVELKNHLNKVFYVKDLGTLKSFLGIEVARSKSGICISQRKYTMDLLRETGKLGARPISSPIEPTINASFEDSKPYFTKALSNKQQGANDNKMHLQLYITASTDPGGSPY